MFQVIGCNSSEKSTVFTFSYRKALVTKFSSCCKIGQGQPRVIIWTNYDGLESPMLHTKFRGNRSTGSREEDFRRVFTIYIWAWQPSWSCDQHHVHKFSFPCTWKLRIKFGFDWPSGFWEKQVLSFVCKWPWAKVKKWPWPSILTYLHYFSWFQVTGCKCSEKSTNFTFSYRKA